MPPPQEITSNLYAFSPQIYWIISTLLCFHPVYVCPCCYINKSRLFPHWKRTNGIDFASSAFKTKFKVFTALKMATETRPFPTWGVGKCTLFDRSLISTPPPFFHSRFKKGQCVCRATKRYSFRWMPAKPRQEDEEFNSEYRSA